jgi:hypothetical protein
MLQTTVGSPEVLDCDTPKPRKQMRNVLATGVGILVVAGVAKVVHGLHHRDDIINGDMVVDDTDFDRQVDLGQMPAPTEIFETTSEVGEPTRGYVTQE